jgi:hypothetical protein
MLIQCNRMLQYKIFDSNQTNCIYKYMNCKRKLMQCNANIKFNKICLQRKLINVAYRWTHLILINVNLVQQDATIQDIVNSWIGISLMS